MDDVKAPPPELTKDGLVTTASNSSSRDHDPVPREGTTEHLPSFEHERALALKFDVRILPCLALMYVSLLDQHPSRACRVIDHCANSDRDTSVLHF